MAETRLLTGTSESSWVRFVSRHWEEGRRKGETIPEVCCLLRLFNPRLPFLKPLWLSNCPLVTMTTVQQSSLGSFKGSTVADKSWMEHSAGSRSPIHEVCSTGSWQAAGKASFTHPVLPGSKLNFTKLPSYLVYRPFRPLEKL